MTEKGKVHHPETDQLKENQREEEDHRERELYLDSLFLVVIFVQTQSDSSEWLIVTSSPRRTDSHRIPNWVNNLVCLVMLSF